MMIFYWSGVIIMAIAMIYSNRKDIKNYLTDITYWITFILISLLSWFSIVFLLIVAIYLILKIAFKNKDENSD